MVVSWDPRDHHGRRSHAHIYLSPGEEELDPGEAHQKQPTSHALAVPDLVGQQTVEGGKLRSLVSGGHFELTSISTSAILKAGPLLGPDSGYLISFSTRIGRIARLGSGVKFSDRGPASTRSPCVLAAAANVGSVPDPHPPCYVVGSSFPTIFRRQLGI